MSASALAWSRVIRDELAPFAGRGESTLRLTLTCALVIVISMTFRIPYLGLSLIAVFYVVQANLVLSRIVGAVVIAGLLLAIPIGVGLLKFSYGHPLPRILSASLVFFCSMYFMRVLKIGPVFLGLGLVALYLQTFADLTDATTYVVEQVLWSCVALVYAALLSLVVNTSFFPAEPLPQFQTEVHRQLTQVARRLEGLLTHEMVQPLSVQALQQGAITLQKLAMFANLRHAKDRAGTRYRQASAAAVSRLRHAGHGLPVALVAPSPVLRDALDHLRGQVLALDASVAAGQPFRMDRAPTAAQHAALQDFPMAQEMLNILHALDSFDRIPLPPEEASVLDGPMLVPDAFSNPVYVRFALKALLCSLIGYVFYNATQWQGIHTMMLTCGLVAYPTLGASMRRMTLRFFGAILGGIVALTLTVFVFPRIDTIVGLLLAVLPAIALGSWISVGAERSSYLGTQMVTTLALTLFEHFGPSTDLAVIRDRLIGILLGVGLCAVVYTCVWPESEASLLRDKLVALRRALAALARPSASAQAEAQLAYARRHLQGWSLLNACEEVAQRVALELPSASGVDVAEVAQVQVFLDRAREALIAGEAVDLGEVPLSVSVTSSLASVQQHA